jgi:hypothetical protein
MNTYRGCLALAVLVVAAMAFPGVASANLFIEETTEVVPTGESKLMAAKYPTTVTGTRLEYSGLKGKIVLLDVEGPGVTFECEAAEVSGGTLSGPASQITLVPKYSNCTAAGIPATVSVNSCKYVLSDFVPDSKAGADVSAKIACNAGDVIKVSSEGCVFSIPAQSLSGESELQTAEPNGEKLVAAGILGSGVKYSANGLTCYVSFGVSNGSYENGTAESHLMFKGS